MADLHREAPNVIGATLESNHEIIKMLKRKNKQLRESLASKKLLGPSGRSTVREEIAAAEQKMMTCRLQYDKHVQACNDQVCTQSTIPAPMI